VKVKSTAEVPANVELVATWTSRLNGSPFVMTSYGDPIHEKDTVLPVLTVAFAAGFCKTTGVEAAKAFIGKPSDALPTPLTQTAAEIAATRAITGRPPALRERRKAPSLHGNPCE
jgi:hypothetical protein